jgi:predicted Zn-dependent protease
MQNPSFLAPARGCRRPAGRHADGHGAKRARAGQDPQPAALGDTESQDLSPLMERKLGEEIMRDIRRDRDYLDDAPILEYMNNFGNALVDARPGARGEAKYDYFFFVVRDPQLNAFALPGGFIAVHSALLLRRRPSPNWPRCWATRSATWCSATSRVRSASRSRMR